MRRPSPSHRFPCGRIGRSVLFRETAAEVDGAGWEQVDRHLPASWLEKKGVRVGKSLPGPRRDGIETERIGARKFEPLISPRISANASPANH